MATKIRSGILKLYLIFGFEPCDDFIVVPWKEALYSGGAVLNMSYKMTIVWNS
jgi:hypothetical protein